ncbi:hypothetical protein EVAR_97153_1 [Eumeta japonica]|uniref:Uncharacterized protein n=1 Tax=Eumeta variegata TaxID=151549 RepID=A0A4C1XT85_EUMVA|nr:hypothetical protein EVAR_97153_1 [Eumeta japonica]
MISIVDRRILLYAISEVIATPYLLAGVLKANQQYNTYDERRWANDSPSYHVKSPALDVVVTMAMTIVSGPRPKMGQREGLVGQKS